MSRIGYSLVSLLVMTIMNIAVYSNASVPDTIGADRDLAVLEEFFQNVPYVSCSIEWKEGNFGGLLTVTNGQCWLRKNNYRINKLYISNVSHEVQNNVFNAFVDNLDSLIVVKTPRSASAAFLQINLLDTLFRSAYVSRMYITDTAVDFKILNVEFKPEAPYARYKMVYHYDQLIPASISIVRKVEKSNGEIGLRQIEITYSLVSFDEFSESVFSTDYLFQKRNGVLEPNPPFQKSQLLDHTWLP